MPFLFHMDEPGGYSPMDWLAVDVPQSLQRGIWVLGRHKDRVRLLKANTDRPKPVVVGDLYQVVELLLAEIGAIGLDYFARNPVSPVPNFEEPPIDPDQQIHGIESWLANRGSLFHPKRGRLELQCFLELFGIVEAVEAEQVVLSLLEGRA